MDSFPILFYLCEVFVGELDKILLGKVGLANLLKGEQIGEFDFVAPSIFLLFFLGYISPKILNNFEIFIFMAFRCLVWVSGSGGVVVLVG